MYRIEYRDDTDTLRTEWRDDEKAAKQFARRKSTQLDPYKWNMVYVIATLGDKDIGQWVYIDGTLDSTEGFDFNQ